MPQLVPFYYINEIFFTFVIISTLIFLLSKYILPNKIRLFISRIFIKII
jgi:F-type H+-transporting ATPase subunit 8